MAGTEKKEKQKMQFGKYLRETKAEMKKVSWPSRQELLQHTGVVVTSIVISGAYLYVIDTGMGEIIKIFISK